MNKKKNEMDELFCSFRGKWDTEEPGPGHQQRFMDRLERSKKRFPYKGVLSIAASVIILLGLFIKYEPFSEKPHTIRMSRENKEAQAYFGSLIKKELASLAKENDPESKRIISDALIQMEKLDDDYKKLFLELSEKGENKQIIHAMITNLQIRISFLEKVSIQIENIKQIKSNYHENKPL